MSVYCFSQEEDRKTLQNLFETHFRKRNFVPFFGSGFTKGCSARNGRVPSTNQLKERLIQTVVKIKNYTKDDQAELEQEKLAQVSEFFWQAMDCAPDDSFKSAFYSYVEDHFSGVHDLAEEKRQLIGCSWRYLYTLNYDDALEGASKDLHCVVPFVPQNKSWLPQKRCLYKLHGDVKQFLSTGDNRFCILSPKQYLSALSDPANSDMLEKLESDFSSNNLIFFGCSLIEEPDLLFVADSKIVQKKMQNSDTFCYYVRYIDEDTPSLTRKTIDQLEQFSITDIIEVTAADMAEFYSFVRRASDSAAAINENDSLAPFTGFSFSQRDAHNRKANIKYLFYSSEIYAQIDANQIVLTSFFTRREAGLEIITDINENHGNLHILRGSRISGRTYILIDLLREFQSRNVYYFRSGKEITSGLLDKLLSMQNAIFLFDDHTLDYEQISFLSQDGLAKLESIHSHAVIVVDCSSGMFTTHYHDAFPELRDRVIIYSPSNKLGNMDNCKEFDNFSREVGKLGVPAPIFNNTFLDFIFQMDAASIQINRSILPDIHVIGEPNREKKLQALILFANQESISIPQANMMGVDTALYELCAISGVDIAIQKDYLSEAELAPDTHHNLRFIINSKYWVYRCLAEYAANKANYASIAKAYYNIVRTIQLKYRFDTAQNIPKNYFLEVKPYYFLDTIQFTFFGLSEFKGSLSLPKMIYDELLPLFRDDYQYLHQKAKCLLWQSKSETTAEGRAALLDPALQQITRAYDLAEKRSSKNIRYTLYHMQVTKALILVNYWRYCRELIAVDEVNTQLSKVLQALYQMEIEMGSCFSDDFEDRLREQEMRDIEWFIKDLGAGETRSLISPSDKTLVSTIITLAFENQHIFGAEK